MSVATQSEAVPELVAREKAILCAVAAGRGELLWGSEPDLAIDGCWCDFLAVHHLVHAGLMAPAVVAREGERVAAVVTPFGRLALDGLPG